MGPFPCPGQAVEGFSCCRDAVAGSAGSAAVGVRAAQAGLTHPQQQGQGPALGRTGIFGAMNTCEDLDRGSRSGHSLLPVALVADGTSIVDAASGQVAVTSLTSLICAWSIYH